MSSSTSTRLPSSNPTHSKRRFTKKELLLHLKILGPITNPLPATLPPSPPASRSASPTPPSSTPSSKRKLDDVETSASLVASTSKRSRSSPQAPLTPPGDEPKEPKVFPVARPRKGRKLDSAGYGPIKDKYMEYGRLFKRSADARINTYNRPESSAFCQLMNRPPLGSPYAKYDRMMSRFEALDGVLCFAYAQWYMELWSNKHDLMWWQNSVSYFELARTKHMEGFSNPGPREEALLGIHFLVDSYWRARYAWHYLRYNVENRVASLLTEHQKSPMTTKSSPASDAGTRSTSVNLNGTTLQPTPPSTGLSPAANQALNGLSTGHSANSRSPVVSPGQRTVPFPDELAKHIQTGTKLHIQSGDSMLYASQRITLNVLEKYFPLTFARVSKSTLKYHEEYEIDFEDDESELYWPLAPTRGEGLGWVLALGRSMLWEYANDFGYKGISGTCRPEDIIYPNRK